MRMLSESSIQTVTRGVAPRQPGLASARLSSTAIAARRRHAGSGRGRRPDRDAVAVASRHSSTLATGTRCSNGPLRCRYQMTRRQQQSEQPGRMRKADHAARAPAR